MSVPSLLPSRCFTDFKVLGEGIMPSPGPMTGRSASRATHFVDSNGEIQPIRRRRTGSLSEEEWDTEKCKWVRVKDPRRGSMETRGERYLRSRSRNNSRKFSRGEPVRRRSSRPIPPKPTRKKTVGFQDPPKSSRRTSSGRRLSRHEASQSLEESPTLTKAEMTGREYRESKAKENEKKAKDEATQKMLEKEAVEKKFRDENANAPKPKNDIFRLDLKKEKQGTGDHALLQWVMDERNDEMDADGKRLAVDGNVGEAEDSAEWVAVRDQNNRIVHIKASHPQLQTKSNADKKIGDIDTKQPDDLTDQEKEMKAQLEDMDKVLAKINKDEGAVLDSDAVGTPETRQEDGKRLQKMREQLKSLRERKDDEAIGRMEAKLAEAQLKHDHPELAPDDRLKFDDDGIIIAGNTPPKAPGFQDEGLLRDGDASEIRRRKSSVYPLSTYAFHT